MTEFSRLATSRLASDLARPNVQVDAPLAVRLLASALVWIEMNRSALASLAISARRFRGIKTSRVRVYTTFTSGQFFCICLPSLSATFRFMFFSLEILPMAPGSCPPCPASMTTTKSFAPILLQQKGAMSSPRQRLIYKICCLYRFILKYRCKDSAKVYYRPAKVM